MTISMNKLLKSALTVTITGCLVGTVFLTGCNKAGNETVATVDGVKITKVQYDEMVDEMMKGLDGMGAAVGGQSFKDLPDDNPQKKMIMTQLKQAALNQLIMKTLIVKAAKDQNIEVTDADVETYKQENIFNVPDGEEQLKAMLEASGLSEEQFEKELREQILVERFVKKIGGDKVVVSDSEVADFYKKQEASFNLPERIRAKHILVKAVEPQLKKEIAEANEEISQEELQKKVQAKKNEAKVKAETLYQQVKKDPSKLSELAKEHSDDPGSAVRGGELGFMSKGTVVDPFWNAMKATPAGQLANGVVESPFGYHIIQVEEKEAAGKKSLAEAKPLITSFIEQQKMKTVLEDWVAERKEVAEIDIEEKYQPEASAGMDGMMQGMDSRSVSPQPATEPAQ